jgi:hypothetical protein
MFQTKFFPLGFEGISYNSVKQIVILSFWKNKIEGTPILKLAEVKRKKNRQKIGQKNCVKILVKKLVKKLVKQFDKKFVKKFV